MARCYTPPDYIALLDAVRLIAETCHPERWVTSSMSSTELSIWNGLDINWNPEYLEDHLRVNVKAHRDKMIFRITSFDDARIAIRNALCSKIITACVFNDSGQRLIIDHEIWRNTTGEIIIRKGTGWFDEGEPEFYVCRCVFLERTAIAKLNKSQSPNSAEPVSIKTPSPEAALCRVVSNLLRINQEATRAQARAAIREAGLAVTANQFQTKIWPQAREAANLPKKAAAGKKRSAPKN